MDDAKRMQVSHTLANLKKIIVIVIFTMNSGQNTDNLMIKVMLSKEALAHLKKDNRGDE